MTQGVNEVLMFGWFGVLILIGVSIIILTSMIKLTGKTSDAFVATSFITFVLSVMMRAMNLLPNNALVVTLIICGGVFAIAWANAR